MSISDCRRRGRAPKARESALRDARFPAAWVAERVSAERGMNIEPRLRQAIDLICAKACEHVTLDDIARQAGFSRRTLERRFKAVLRCAPHDLRRQARLNVGCELLLNTDMRIYRISEHVGYCEPKLFAREFRLMFGVTPKTWRRQMRGDSGFWTLGARRRREPSAEGAKTGKKAD